LLSDLIQTAGHQQQLKGILGMPLARRPCVKPGSPCPVPHDKAAAVHAEPALLAPELLRQPPPAHLVPAPDGL